MSGEANANANSNATKRKQRHGLISHLIHLVFTLLLASLLSWIFLLIWFGICRVTQGNEVVEQQINSILKTNITLLNDIDFFGIGNGYQAFQAYESQLVKRTMENEQLNQGMTYLQRQKSSMVNEFYFRNKSSIAKVTENLKIFTADFLSIFWGITVILFSRVFIFLLAMPLFVICACIGFVDGLVQRDIRKFQAARESTLLFHEVKKRIGFWFFIPLLIYFALPRPVSPAAFLVPMAVGLGLLIQLSMRSFKKYV